MLRGTILMNPLTIFLEISLPIFLLIGTGWVADRALKFDLSTLSRILFYLLSPIILLDVTMNTTLNAADLSTAFTVVLVQYILLWLGSAGIFTLRPFRDKRTILSLSSVFRNNANYGIPLMLLAFGVDGVSVSAVFIVINSILLFTLGIMMMERKDGISLKDSARHLLGVPSIWGIVIGLLLRALGLEIPQVLAGPYEYLRASYTGLALITLGAQLNRIRLGSHLPPVITASALRLIASPLLMAMICIVAEVPAPLASMLIVASGVPTAVNVYITAAEYNCDPELSSEIIFLTTLASAITVPLVISIMG